MNFLKTNLSYLLEKRGHSLLGFLKTYAVKDVENLPLSALLAFCREEEVSLENLLFYPHSFDPKKAKNIRFLILDIDGVMTDGGMYFTESGDQFKKYNTKDGMGIMKLHKLGIKTGIISSGFKEGMVKARAELLNIEHVYVGREPKIDILRDWCATLNIDFSQVGIIGDDINDLEIMKNVGFSACPADAVSSVKKQVDVVLQKEGGRGCVRELIDHYLLSHPLE